MTHFQVSSLRAPLRSNRTARRLARSLSILLSVAFLLSSGTGFAKSKQPSECGKARKAYDDGQKKKARSLEKRCKRKGGKLPKVTKNAQGTKSKEHKDSSRATTPANRRANLKQKQATARAAKEKAAKTARARRSKKLAKRKQAKAEKKRQEAEEQVAASPRKKTNKKRNRKHNRKHKRKAARRSRALKCKNNAFLGGLLNVQTCSNATNKPTSKRRPRAVDKQNASKTKRRNRPSKVRSSAIAPTPAAPRSRKARRSGSARKPTHGRAATPPPVQPPVSSRARSATLRKVKADKKPGVSYDVFDVELGEGIDLPPCKNNSGRSSTCTNDSMATLGSELMRFSQKASGSSARRSSTAMVVVKLADKRCPNWLRSGGACLVIFTTKNGVALGASMVPGADSAAYNDIVSQLTQKYRKKPSQGDITECRNNLTGIMTDEVHSLIWSAPGLQVTYDPLVTDCKRGRITVELDTLRRLQQKEQAAHRAAQPQM